VKPLSSTYILILMIFSVCSPTDREEGTQNHLSGEQLANIYCRSCHLFTKPELLHKKAWASVLPSMGHRLGIGTGLHLYGGMAADEITLLFKHNIFPMEPVISDTAWEKIQQYYLSEAPDEPLPVVSSPPINIGLAHFKTTAPQFNSQLPSLITLVKFDSSSARLFIGDAQNYLTIIDSGLQRVTKVPVDSPPSFVSQKRNQTYVLTMGIMNPSDNALGKFTRLDGSAKADLRPNNVLLDKLSRPVHATLSDLNQNGKEDILICGFGNLVGKFSWFENLGDQQYKEHVLKDKPGALKSYIKDFDRDGSPDIITLMGQGEEGIFIFYNQGDGVFKEEAVQRFHPLYGSMHFELADFNKDGWPDILYVNGDNGDLTNSLKNYHGIRIFLNDGNNQFQESFFYPLHGATKAIARDFDKDGDLDIAAIAFFPDYINSPLQSFVYLENQGALDFEASTFPEASNGRWLVLEAGDIDNDQDTDLILGSFIYGVTPVPDDINSKWKENPQPVIILENQLN